MASAGRKRGAILLVLATLGSLHRFGRSLRTGLSEGFAPTHGEHLRASTTFDESPTSKRCEAILRPRLKKVALLFLVYGDIPHERAWARWLEHVEQYLPSSIVCTEEAYGCFKETQKIEKPKSALDRQWLYTIYVHTKPGYNHQKGFPEGNIFHGRVIKDLVQTAWGNHSLITATRNLITEALKDPYNQRFQILCETSIPIRNSMYTFEQLLALNASRIAEPIRVKPGKTRSGKEFLPHIERWPLPMQEEFPELQYYMRGNGQFVTLIRQHAQCIHDEEFMFQLFAKHCTNKVGRHGTWCVSDEQYMGTVIGKCMKNDFQGTYSDEYPMVKLGVGSGVTSEELTVDLIIAARGRSKNISMVPYYAGFSPGECNSALRPQYSLVDVSEEEKWKADNECYDNPALGEPEDLSRMKGILMFWRGSPVQDTASRTIELATRFRGSLNKPQAQDFCVESIGNDMTLVGMTRNPRGYCV